MPFQGIQAGRPELPVRLKPLVDGPERLGPQPVQPALGVRARGDQAGLPQHPQVLRHSRLAHAEHTDKVRHAALRFAQEIEDGAPMRLREDLEKSGHTELACLISYIAVKAYKIDEVEAPASDHPPRAASPAAEELERVAAAAPRLTRPDGAARSGRSAADRPAGRTHG